MKATHAKNRIALFVAEFFYCGRFSLAPGTMGSLGSLVIWIPSIYFAWPLWINIALLIGLFAVGVWASGYAIVHYKKSDPPQVVIDEVVGQGLPFLVIGPSVIEIVFAFALFRLFDIWKPWPIRKLEKMYQDKWGIMIDDVVAGIFAAMVLLAGKYLIAVSGT